MTSFRFLLLLLLPFVAIKKNLVHILQLLTDPIQ